MASVGRWLVAALLMPLGACMGGGGSSSDAPQTVRSQPVPAGWVHGLTLDAVDDVPAIVDALAALPRRATVRIVFDEDTVPADYADAVAAIANVADIQGELLDSSAMASYTREAYRSRTRAWLTAFGASVSHWEIGNEINGDWLGPGAIDKAHDAFQLVEAAGGATTLTLYYNAGCEDDNGPMLDWVTAHVPQDMRDGLETVAVSYYEDDCNGRVVPREEWISVFSRLHDLFPSAQLMMGEVGTVSPDAKATLMQRYYGDMRLPEVPAFVGGFFWWYGRQDVVPRSQPLWQRLAELWAAEGE